PPAASWRAAPSARRLYWRRTYDAFFCYTEPKERYSWGAACCGLTLADADMRGAAGSMCAAEPASANGGTRCCGAAIGRDTGYGAGARDPNTLDPALVSDTGSAFLVRQLFSGLVRLDAELAVQPDLAESWAVSDDQRTYTFTLRPDARFADGTPITAEDVRYSLERATDPQLAEFLPAQTYLRDIVGVPEKLSGQADTISGIQVLDEQQISITIDGAKSFFLSKLAHPTSFIVDRRAAERGGNWTDAPNGSGPFTIDRWDHDQLLELRRNENFYREPASLDGVRFLIGAAANNPLILYEQGAIDLTGVPSFALARVQDENNALAQELVSVPQLSLSYIGMNVTMPPFDDPKVRQAFALLLDRERLAEVTLNESATAARGILPPACRALTTG
ncbi:hypothetical protein HC891_12945, partial [Candidatus Gracilibacteria bacterium]|nr:hypothetical protein [Candidatus Gracilibacteria bacterium]